MKMSSDKFNNIRQDMNRYSYNKKPMLFWHGTYIVFILPYKIHLKNYLFSHNIDLVKKFASNSWLKIFNLIFNY